jgi:coenzyme PQQ precursor peptide PqqA
MLFRHMGLSNIPESGFLKEIIMWTKPTATEMRFGFEVTMYVMNK